MRPKRSARSALPGEVQVAYATLLRGITVYVAPRNIPGRITVRQMTDLIGDAQYLRRIRNDAKRLGRRKALTRLLKDVVA